MSAGRDKQRPHASGDSGGRAVGRAAGRIAGVDGLRAIAAMLVLAYHAASLSGITLTGPLALVPAELKAGVAVFFVVSGFLLYLPFSRAIATVGRLPSWREYASKRAVRILPAYWAALVLLAAAHQLHGVSVVNAWRYFDLVQIYRLSTMQGGLPIAWSLCVEITFYIALPILAWLIVQMARRSSGRFEPQVVLIAALALGSIALRAMLARSLLAPVGNDQLVLATALPGMIDWFALGMGLAVLRVAIELGARPPSWLVALARRPGLCWLIAAAVYFAGEPAQRFELYLPAFGVAAHAAIGLAALLLVLPVVPPRQQSAKGFVVPLLCSRVVAWLGLISYGIYLWHVPFLKALDAAVGHPRGVEAFTALLAATAAGAVCLGAASWYLIERPAHRLHARGAIGRFGRGRLAGDAT